MQSIPGPVVADGNVANGADLERKPESRQTRAWARPHPWALLLLIAIIGLLARLHNLGVYSLWRDEGYSARAITHSYFYLWNILPRFEFNPAGYYVVLKAWTTLAGNSEFALRLLSVLFNVATIPVVFVIGRMLGDRVKSDSCGGLLAAGIFTLSALQLQYAQDARGYTLLVFIVSLATLAALRIMRDWDSSAVSAANWIALGILLGLIPWIHYTGALAVFALGVALAYWWLNTARRDRRAFKGLLLAAAVCVVVLLPNLFSLLGRAADVYRGYWITRPGLEEIFSAALRFSGTSFAGTREVIFMLFLLLSLSGIRVLWKNGKSMAALLLISLGLLPPLLEIAISYIAMPVFLERTFLYASIPLSVLVGHGLESLGGRFKTAVVAILFTLLGINAVGYLANADKESWKDLVAYLSSKMGPGEPVFYTNTSSGWAMSYYIDRTRASFASHGVPFREADYGVAERDEILQPDTGRQVNAEDITKVRALMAGAARVGVVLWDEKRSDPRQLLVGEVGKEFRLVDEKKIAGMVVLIFDRRR